MEHGTIQCTKHNCDCTWLNGRIACPECAAEQAEKIAND